MSPTPVAEKPPATKKGKELCNPLQTLGPKDLTEEADENESADDILQRQIAL
jgi:hypothetical protein